MTRRLSTGNPGLDGIVDGLRLGDNVVWRVDSIDDFACVVEPFVGRARADGRRVVHVRFGDRPAWPGLESRVINPGAGFESFAMAVHEELADIGPEGCYVFDPLVDLHRYWQSDVMVLNFFKVTCPYLFRLDTIAYFAVLRDQHTHDTVAGVRETTQVFLDLHRIDDELYVQPLKVWQRHSPTMFFPHRLADGEAISITSSDATARLFARLGRPSHPPDPWQRRIDDAWQALDGTEDDRERARRQVQSMLVGQAGRMTALADSHLSLTDLLAVASRQLGTGAIGGKAVGMLTARSILERDSHERFSEVLEPHDSFYLGSDAFISFLIVNGWWDLWRAHKSDAYYEAAAELSGLIPSGVFRRGLRDQFLEMLEYFGQAPLIARSSSLLEDNYGHAFADKYESAFLTNQGTPDDRLEALERAIKLIYASAVSDAALRYRDHRGLSGRDEQMAVLIQRVSGDQHDGLFLPDAAGVANSSSLYVWRSDLPDYGMTRIVAGLGTRAVDRAGLDYARIVALADPTQSPIEAQDAGRYSQRRMDLLDLTAGRPATLAWPDVRRRAPDMPWHLLAEDDVAAGRRMRELGRRGAVPELLGLTGLLQTTGFPAVLRQMLRTLSLAYQHPVDIEYTVNVSRSGEPKINLVQCRPLQTRGLGPSQDAPRVEPDACLLATDRFMGGNARLPLDAVIVVRPERYLRLGEQDRYAVARGIGVLNRVIGSRTVMLIGPGRWGTTTPSLGVPVHFTEINHVAVLCETTFADGRFLPELSYGSHFFQELVEGNVFYVAVFEDRPGAVLRPDLLAQAPNRLIAWEPALGHLSHVLHLAETPGLLLHSDVVSQQLVVQFDPRHPPVAAPTEDG